MADDVRLDVARLDAMIRLLPIRARQLAALLGEQVVTRTKELAPVQTGRLRASYTAVVQSDALGASVQIGTNVEYAPFVEFGTSRIAAKPHFRPAVEQVRAQLPRATGELFKP